MAIYRYDKYGVWSDEKLEDTDRELSLSRLTTLEKYETPEDTDFIEVPYTWGSDYSGGSVTVSNFRSLWRDYSEKIPQLYKVYGDYSTYGLVVQRSIFTATDEDSVEFVETMRQLEDSYCLYDEDDNSAVEMEAEQEAWDNCYRSDYRRELEKLETLEEDSDDTVSDDTLWETLRLVMDRENEYWSNETGNSAYVDIERIARATTEEDITTARDTVASYSTEQTATPATES